MGREADAHNWIPSSSGERISTSSIHDANLLRPKRTRAYLTAAVWIGIPMTVFAVLGFYELSPAYGNPEWVPGVAALLEAALAIFLIQVMAAAALNVGISLQGQGVVYYYTTVRPGIAIRRCIPWDNLHRVAARGGSVSVGTGRTPITLTYEQARVVLTDPRCPLRGQVPDAVRRRIGIPVA